MTNKTNNLQAAAKKRKKVDIPRIKMFIRALISVYSIILAIRVILYLYIVKYVDLLSTQPQLDNHFGMFLGNALTTNKGVAILATFIIITLIILCFSLSITSIRYLSEVEEIMTVRGKLQNESETIKLLNTSDFGERFA